MLIYVIFAVFAAVSAEEKGSACSTPNGEKATCIPINSCPPIKFAISYLDEDAIKFAKQSQCGYDEMPLVCCGSAGQITTPAAPTKSPPKHYEPPAVGDNTKLAEPIKHLLLPDNSLCGLQSRQNKESGKSVTQIHEYPWLVSLKYEKDDKSPGGFRCSGTLINQRYVLTAAQCLNIKGFNLTQVRLGEWNFTSGDDCYYHESKEENVCVKPRDITIIEKIPHPYYNIRSGNNDIALLRIEGKIRYDEYIRPICLPPSEFLPPPAGTPMEATGWKIVEDGAPTGVKLKTNFSMVGHEECDKAFQNYTQLYINKACVRSDEASGCCIHDSGRPLLRNYFKEDETDERQWYQEGILYKGLGCEEKGTPGLYMRVSRYINWILSNLKKT